MWVYKVWMEARMGASCSLSPCHLISETGLSLNLELDWQSAIPSGFLVSLTVLGSQVHVAMLAFSMVAEDLNSGPHAYTVSDLIH